MRLLKKYKVNSVLKRTRKKLEKKSANLLFDTRKKIILENFGTRGGNVSPYELQVISLMVATLFPKVLLEIGTFDGTTTLQMALNSPDNSVIHTLDLPEGVEDTLLHSIGSDRQYIVDKAKLNKKFKNNPVEKKIIQHLGDSASYNFKRFADEGEIGFCFIDGGHSYESVKNDTEKVFPLIKDKGIVCWHDLDHEPISRYLGEIGDKIPLTLILETKLVIHEKNSNSKL